MDTVEEIVDYVYKTWKRGRIASWQSISVQMNRVIAEGGVGIHLEIGVLHGATLAMAALVKKHVCKGGLAIGVDPLDGYYPPSALHDNFVRTREGHQITARIERRSNEEISLEIVQENLAQYDIEDFYTVVRKFSYPWPEELYNMQFETVYVDGDHYRLGPIADWINVHTRVRSGGYVMFDDCNTNCPDVQQVAAIAARTPGWEEHDFFQKHCFVVRKQ